MAAFSTLRSKSFNERFIQFSKAYAVHRPLVQRCLNTAFIFYVLGSTYRGLSARPGSSSSSKGKGKAKDDGKETGKPPRVAVGHYSHYPNLIFITFVGRRGFLSTPDCNPPNCNPKYPIQRSATAGYAL